MHTEDCLSLIYQGLTKQSNKQLTYSGLFRPVLFCFLDIHWLCTSEVILVIWDGLVSCLKQRTQGFGGPAILKSQARGI